jgi:NHLM bacteriocin system ABC transporter ATP-binding protein
MGWFDEQIRQRSESDQEIFEDSIYEMMSAVMGRHASGELHDRRVVTKAAIDEILKYYRFKPVEIPDTIREPEEQLEYALRPHGLVYRFVTLSENWYRTATGPLIAYRREDGLPIVLYPKSYGGYYWHDAAGRRIAVNRRTACLLAPEAICFYSPLPMGKLGASDLLGYMKNCLNGGDYAVLLGLTLLVTLVGLMVPRLTKLLTGFVLGSGNTLILWTSAVFLLCVLVTSQLLSASRALAMSRIQIKAAVPMEAAMMMRLLNLPASFFKQYSAGELASRSGAVNRLCGILLGGVFSLGVTALFSLLYINQTFAYAPALAGPALIVVLLTAGITVIIGLLETKETRLIMAGNAAEAGISYALISGVQKIRLSGAEKRAFSKWASSYAGGAEVEFNPPLFLKLRTAILLGVSLLGNIVIYYFAVASEVSPSAYLAFSAAYGAVTGAFSAFSGIAASAAQIKPILEMAEPILKTEPETAEDRELVTRLSGGIELNNVSFRYREDLPYVLNGLNLRVRPGEYLAIVGRTGCGKSTLMRLLLGFETPEKGAVYYDRKDIRTLDLSTLRRAIGAVTQDGTLFQGDIYSNITVAAPQLTLEEAWEAAEIAGIAEDIRAMPMGMHTFISEGQGGFSGGQKQRLMIARAIAPKPKILLFDEATSALDNKTQKQISQALDKLNCTRIVIAHRLSTIRNCDRILVLDGGKIIEEGTYESLIAKGGFFAELVERQRLD